MKLKGKIRNNGQPQKPQAMSGLTTPENHMGTIYKAHDVAAYVIKFAQRKIVGDNGEPEGITNLKLQKILYFIQVHCLIFRDAPLFSDPIEAWEYGPVIPAIYNTYKNCGSNPITEPENDSSQNETIKELSAEDKVVVDTVWDAYGGYSAHWLVNATHQHTPWKEAYAAEDHTIALDAMKTYYTPLYLGPQ